MLDAYAVAVDKVGVVPHGIEATLGVHATSAAELRRTYGLGSGPVIVLPAMTHPHKGHVFVINVMHQYWTDPTLRLVLIGGQGAAETVVNDLIGRLGEGSRIRRLGRVSAQDRDGLIAMSAALVFPSEYEGFGAPVVEAMALGTPVICSDRTCLPEVAGDAAEVLPLVPTAWEGALQRVEQARESMVVRGRTRALQFSTAQSATALVRSYERALQ